jgi:RNA polymerase sigma-70 factor (ECF subfamily)
METAGYTEESAIAMYDKAQQDFEELLSSNRGIVLKVAQTYCFHPDDRADLVQEIATQLWRAWPRYDPQRKFTTWMYRIALNVAISFVRNEAQRRHNTVPLEETLHDTADTSSGDPESQARVQQLLGFINRQPPLDRALLLLYLEERSQREIAEILGMTETNVSTKIGRLKQRIRNEM